MISQIKLQLIAGRGLCCAAAIFFSTAAKALDPADKVLESSRATVTAEDIDRYILENLPKDRSERAAVLRNPSVYREMAETL